MAATPGHCACWSAPPSNGVRSVDIHADKVSTKNILLALRMKDLTYSADLPLSGEFKGELGRDGLPTYFRGKMTVGAGPIIDTDTPDYPMADRFGRSQYGMGFRTSRAGSSAQNHFR